MAYIGIKTISLGLNIIIVKLTTSKHPTLSVSQKRADMLNLSMNEVTVTGLHGDQQYQCVLEKIESYSVICKIKGEPGAVPAVDSFIVSVF